MGEVVVAKFLYLDRLSKFQIKPNFMSQLGNQGFPQPQGGASSGDLAMAYINSLTARFERTEEDFIDHIKKIESRLDQLIDLMKAVATLQQQISSHSDVLGELRSAQREQAVRLEQNLVRVHERVDEVLETITSKVSVVTNKLDSKVEALEKRVTVNERDFQMWYNRGAGAWAVSVLIFGAIQFFGIRWLDQIERERTETLAAINKLVVRVTEIEHRQTVLEPRHTPPR